MAIIWNQGMLQQTPAVMAIVRGARPASAPRRKRAKAAAPRKRRAKRAAAGGNKFKKGSAAAKRHMARLRKMRK